MLTYTLSTTKAKFKNKSCKIVKFLHWSFANAIGSMFCMYDLINPWIISVVMFEFLSKCLIPVPLWAHSCSMSAALCAKPRLAVIPWEPKLNTALGNSSAEALPSQCSCYRSCCCLCSAFKAAGSGGQVLCSTTLYANRNPLPLNRSQFVLKWPRFQAFIESPALCCLPSSRVAAPKAGALEPHRPQKHHSPSCWPHCSDSQHWYLSLHRSQGFISFCLHIDYHSRNVHTVNSQPHHILLTSISFK